MVLTLALAPSALASSASIPEPDSILYELNWTVGKDGRQTKTYRLTYRGNATLARLAEFGGAYPSSERLRWIRNLLPQLQQIDQPTGSTELNPGAFEFNYNAPPSNGPGTLRDPLLVDFPVFTDPISQNWNEENGSRFWHEMHELRIVTVLKITVPWSLKEQEIKRDQDFAHGIRGTFSITAKKSGEMEARHSLDLPDASPFGSQRTLDFWTSYGRAVTHRPSQIGLTAQSQAPSGDPSASPPVIAPFRRPSAYLDLGIGGGFSPVSGETVSGLSGWLAWGYNVPIETRYYWNPVTVELNWVSAHKQASGENEGFTAASPRTRFGLLKDFAGHSENGLLLYKRITLDAALGYSWLSGSRQGIGKVSSSSISYSIGATYGFVPAAQIFLHSFTLLKIEYTAYPSSSSTPHFWLIGLGLAL